MRLHKFVCVCVCVSVTGKRCFMKLNNSGKNFRAKCLLRVTRTATVVDKYLYYFVFFILYSPLPFLALFTLILCLSPMHRCVCTCIHSVAPLNSFFFYFFLTSNSAFQKTSPIILPVSQSRNFVYLFVCVCV